METPLEEGIHDTSSAGEHEQCLLSISTAEAQPVACLRALAIPNLSDYRLYINND